MARRVINIALLLLFAAPAQAATPSGLPVPRFVSLKSAEVNVRTGPGTRYPIQWVYRREGMPVEIIEEFDLWRKIRDMDGVGGWVHKNMLEGRRMAVIHAKAPVILRAEPKPKARPLLKIEPQVVARLAECEKDWCRIQVTGRKGWLEKKYLWGVYPAEIIE